MQRLPNPGLKPSREGYERFAEDLEESPKHILEAGLQVFLGLLFFIPATVFLAVIVTGLFGELPLKNWGIGGLLAGLGPFLIFQAYQGIVRRKVRILPRSKMRSETAYVGDKISETLKGKRAIIAGWIFLVLGMACFGIATCRLFHKSERQLIAL